jgi:riboflavin kinase/FMN adenylyltransferase
LHRPARDGIYIGETRVGRRWHPSAVFIGAALTFGQSDRRLETTLLDYSGSLYGQWVTVRLLKRIRGNREFPNVIALKSAMADDLKKVREFFSSSPTA